RKRLCAAEKARLRDRLMLGAGSAAGFIFVQRSLPASNAQVSWRVGVGVPGRAGGDAGGGGGGDFGGVGEVGRVLAWRGGGAGGVGPPAAGGVGVAPGFLVAGVLAAEQDQAVVFGVVGQAHAVARRRRVGRGQPVEAVGVGVVGKEVIRPAAAALAAEGQGQ